MAAPQEMPASGEYAPRGVTIPDPLPPTTIKYHMIILRSKLCSD